MTNFIDYVYIDNIPLYEIMRCCCVCNNYNFIRGGTCGFVSESYVIHHFWPCDNLHVTRERGYPVHFRVEIWFYTVGDIVADPYLLPAGLTNRR